MEHTMKVQWLWALLLTTLPQPKYLMSKQRNMELLMKNKKLIEKMATVIILLGLGWVVYVNFGLFCCTSF
jgi:hypothetical protein